MGRSHIEEELNYLSNPSYGSHFNVNTKGHLEIDGCDSVELAKQYGTPLFVISESTIRDNYRRFFNAVKSRYPKVLVCYGSKANHRLAIFRILQQEGAGGDVVGPAQMHGMLRIGMDPARIVFNGNHKTEPELIDAISAGVGAINVDSLQELNMIDEIAAKLGKVQKIHIRIKPDYEALLSEESQWAPMRRSLFFGIDIPSGQAFEAASKALHMKNVELRGIHNHVGWLWMIPDSKGIYDKNVALRRSKANAVAAMDFAGKLKQELGFEAKEIDLGGGLRGTVRDEGFGYSGPSREPTIEESIDTIVSVVKQKAKEYSFEELPLLEFEPGGYMVSNAEALLTKVGYIKEVPTGTMPGKYVSIDVSGYIMVRKMTTSYGFYHHTIVANKAGKPPEEKVFHLKGVLCCGDVFGTDLNLPRVGMGDLIAFLDVGSYNDCMASNYNGYPLPATVLASNGRSDITKWRETTEDVHRLDRIPSWLLGSYAR